MPLIMEKGYKDMCGLYIVLNEMLSYEVTIVEIRASVTLHGVLLQFYESYMFLSIWISYCYFVNLRVLENKVKITISHQI